MAGKAVYAYVSFMQIGLKHMQIGLKQQNASCGVKYTAHDDERRPEL